MAQNLELLWAAGATWGIGSATGAGAGAGTGMLCAAGMALPQTRQKAAVPLLALPHLGQKRDSVWAGAL